MKFKCKDCQIPAKTTVDLKKWPTQIKALYSSKEHSKELLTELTQRLSALQEVHYASRNKAVLLIFQGMDAAGKDGIIKHVMSGVNPQGCLVRSFKHPSGAERSHDFLWRTTLQLPERGHIGIFNRSYYEDVLIVRVHPKILVAENISMGEIKKGKIWDNRFESINAFEKHLYREDTLILKFFLHLSKEEQRKRFLARIDEPDKNWKMRPSDVEERKYWDDYMRVYADCLSQTSSKHAPWYVIPADDKDNARLIVSRVLVETLESLKLKFPEVSAERRRELKSIRKQLEKE